MAGDSGVDEVKHGIYLKGEWAKGGLPGVVKYVMCLGGMTKGDRGWRFEGGRHANHS
jgi:hypothetical protein